MGTPSRSVSELARYKCANAVNCIKYQVIVSYTIYTIRAKVLGSPLRKVVEVGLGA